MLSNLKLASLECGFTTYIAQSDRDIQTQLNRIVREGQLPLSLVSWDLNVDLAFNASGHLENPKTKITMLLVDKSLTLDKDDLEAKSEEMALLFIKFIRSYKDYLVLNTNVKEDAVTAISYTHVPKYGAGQHSGVLATFVTQLNLEPKC